MSELSTTIGSVMQHKSGVVWSTGPHATVFEAIEMMAEKEVGALVVMDNGELVGIVSERDYARKVVLQGRLSKETPVADIMSSPVVCVSPRHTVGECMRVITDNRIRHLPVMQNGELVGVVSIGDLVNWVIREQETTIKHLEAYISGMAS
jgi:CBS domain-containing protein